MRERTSGPDVGEVDLGERDRVTAQRELARQQRVAPSAIAEHMVSRDRNQPQRRPPLPEQAREQRALGKPADDVVVHASPRSAAMLAA